MLVDDGGPGSYACSQDFARKLRKQNAMPYKSRLDPTAFQTNEMVH
jgi:hypothetical protein